MPNPIPVAAPAAYAPLSAVGFAEADSTLSPVSATKPLPVSLFGQAAPAPLTGSTTVSGQVGPFTPVIGKPVVLALTGEWSGTVSVLRSTDGGTSRLAITAGGAPWAQFSANCCEPVWEEATDGATLYLDITLSAGSVIYRMGQ